MNKWLTYILISFWAMASLSASAQIDKILKPVEINPPHPPLPNQQPTITDEQLAAQYFRERDFEKAIVLYKKLYETKNNSIYYTYYLYCLIQLQDYGSAEQLVKKQIKGHPDGLKYEVDLGYVYTESGDQRKAGKLFDQVLKDIPGNRARITELANAFLYRGQTEYAVIVYQKGGRIINYPFYMELGDLYRQVSNYADMIESYLNHVDYNYAEMARVQNNLQSVLSSQLDDNVNEYLRVALLSRIQKDPEKVYFAEMLEWLSIQNKDFEMALMQARSIDRRLNEDGFRLYELANICISNQAYNVAIEAYKGIIKKGEATPLYVDARIGVLNAHYLKVTKTHDYTEKDLTDLEKEYVLALENYGKNASTIVIMRYLGHLQGFYLDKADDAVSLLWEAVSIPNASIQYVAECKIELADILLLTGDVWEAKLLYSQVEKSFKNDPIGFEAKLKNAKLSFYIGEYAWAKAQLDVLKAATSKLIANDALYLSVLISDNLGEDSVSVALDMYAKADLLLYRHQYNDALALLDSIFTLSPWHAIFDDVLLKKSEILMSLGKYEDATVILNDLVQNYAYDITADNALFMLAVIYDQHINDEAKAMTYYQKLITDYPGSLFVVDARKRFRYLRGDNIDAEGMSVEEMFFYDIEPEN
jgi:tetratricopeptide (TPR) repeat protein